MYVLSILLLLFFVRSWESRSKGSWLVGFSFVICGVCVLVCEGYVVIWLSHFGRLFSAYLSVASVLRVSPCWQPSAPSFYFLFILVFFMLPWKCNIDFFFFFCIVNIWSVLFLMKSVLVSTLLIFKCIALFYCSVFVWSGCFEFFGNWKILVI